MEFDEVLDFIDYVFSVPGDRMPLCDKLRMAEKIFKKDKSEIRRKLEVMHEYANRYEGTEKPTQ